MKYKRVLLKLSGESLSGDQALTIDPKKLTAYAQEVRSIVEMGIEVGIVMGGGNIYRGNQGAALGIDRVQGDYMGMLATIINNMALQDALEREGLKTKHLSGLVIDPLCEKISARKAIKHLQSGHVVLLSGGTGNPFFTTDSAAALRAAEINADAVLKATRVDGIYSADPEKDPAAVRFERLTFAEAYEKQLSIMDLTAFTLCRENNIPVVVFDINVAGNLKRVILGEAVGTLVS